MKTISYFGSYAISLLGNSIANVILPVLVLVSTGEPLMAGTVALASGASTIFFGSLTGPLIDKYDKRVVAGFADLTSAASIGLLAGIATFGELSPVWFIVSAFLSGAGDMPAWNAREAMIYGVQRHSQSPLETLVGIRETLSALAIVIGPTSAGLLMNYFDARTILWVTCLTSLVAAMMIFFSPSTLGKAFNPEGPEEKTKFFQSLSEGLKFFSLKENKVLRSLTGLNIASIALVSVLQSLLIPVVMTLNNAGESNGYALAAIGIGLLLGGAAYAFLGTKMKPWPLLAASMLLNVLALALLVQFTSVPYTIALCFAFGLTSSAVGAVTGVISLKLTPETMRGRITSLQNSVSMIVGPIAIFSLSWVISTSSLTFASIVVAVLWGGANLALALNSEFRKSIKSSDSTGISPVSQESRSNSNN